MDFPEWINKVFAQNKLNQSSVVIYRLPNASQFYLIIDNSGGKYIDSPIKITETNGFVAQPFDPTKKAILINPDQFYIINPDLPFPEIQVINKIKVDFDVQIPQKPSTDKSHYLSVVENSIQLIKANRLTKVVIARQKTLTTEQQPNLGNLFVQMCDKFINAMVSLRQMPDGQVWFGATPEVLLSVANNELKTVALAGTKVYNPSESLRDVLWSQKEIEEQALVSRYIVDAFKKLRYRFFDEQGPYTFRAGNLVHLKTDFSVSLPDTNDPLFTDKLFALLHPTSAVCGSPRQNAFDYITENEVFNREFYSGVHGPVNINNETHLFVNLRCGTINQHQVTLYAGAGITQESNPEAEWLETTRKLQSVGSLLFNESLIRD